MKKIISGIIIALSLIVSFTGSTASASSLWNGASNDCQGLTIANASTNTGFASPCWSSTSISGVANDAINVRLYYHNSSDLTGTSQTATNVKLSLTADSGSSTNHTFSGQLSSDQGSISLGSVSLNLNSAQTVAFYDARWYPNQTQTQATFPSGNGSAIMSGGVNIGSVAPGWGSQGSIVVSFLVGQTSIPVQTCTDSRATNYGGPLPCNIPTVQYCNDSRATNYGSQGTCAYYTPPVQNYNYCTISYFSASPTYITSGQASTLTWSTNNCTSVNISNLGNVSVSGSQNIYPSYSTNYTLTAYGSNGNPSQTVYVTVNPIVYQQPIVTYVPPVYNPPVVYNNACAVTTVATNVNTNSATLNGLITSPNGGVANSYFQYGTTINLGLTTQSSSTNGTYSQSIGGLAPDTAYYFRSVSNCSNGLAYGQIEVFSTTGATATTTNVTRIIQGTTVVGTASPILLKIEDRYQSITVGDTIDYTVTYKNIGHSTLTNPVLQVVVPKGITLTNSSAGTYSKDTNTLTVPLNDLKPNDGGQIFIQGHVDSIPDGTAQIVTTAILVYTSPSGAQENAIAYVLNNPSNLGNNLGAAAFWAGFGGIGLIGWLLLLILILLIILATRSYRQQTTVHKIDPTGATTTTTTVNH